jgi:hypothetical protein
MILANSKSEMGMVMIEGQHGQNVHNIPFQTIKDWVQWLVPVIPVRQGSINRRVLLQAGLGIMYDPNPRNNQSKKGWGHG